MSVIPADAVASARARHYARFVAAAGLLLLVYAILVPLVAANDRVVGNSGPLSRSRPSATAPPPGANVTLSQVHRACGKLSALSSAGQIKIVAGSLDGRPYFACYGISASGSTKGAAVVDGDAIAVHDSRLIKRTGAWRWIGTVKTPMEMVLGGLAAAVVPAFVFLYYRRPRPGSSRSRGFWASRWVDAIIGVLGPVGWLVLAFDKQRSSARKIRLIMMSVLGFAMFMCFALLADASNYPDPLGLTVTGLLTGQVVLCLAMGRLQVAPPGFGETVETQSNESLRRYDRSTPAARPAPAPTQQSTDAPSSMFRIKQPGDLATFAQVGGMDTVKQEVEDSVGLLLAFEDEAETYKLTFNGILLYGPPGTGKTFFAQATAGEFGLRYLRVAVSDLVSKYAGESAKNIERVFATAAANLPCVLFFDEFDSVAGRRDDDSSEENRRVVNQLLTSLEQYRSLRELVVMAATNDIEQLDPAVIRPGRFDRRIRIDLPDGAARRSILQAQLAGRPLAPGVDLPDIARRTEGLSGAAISSLVGEAALAAFRETTASGAQVSIGTAHLLGALAARGGKDRPTVENWSWDKLVLDDATKAELRQIQKLIEDPRAAQAYGVETPSGLLLTGPAGTGKTTIARVFAAEARCSFYPITAADLTSKWVGESENNVARLFSRARENTPSIVFIDEIDAVAGTRGATGDPFASKILNQLLAEMDGLKSGGRVFVMGATNRVDVLDPAIRRGGRLSRTMLIGLPQLPQREALLKMFTERMPLDRVGLDKLAADAEGLAGADLEALCQQAAVAAMTRTQQRGNTAAAPGVTTADFQSALATVHEARSASNDSPHSPDLASFLSSLSGKSST